jgi:L-lactate dehydrogenase complex protein LldE
MIRVFYLDLLRDDAALLQQARELSARVYEFSEFLVKVLGVEDLGARYPGTATYHSSCHQLRELEVREEPKRLLRHVRDLQLRELPQEEACCGFGGTFTVKFPHISQGMLDDKIANITATGAGTLVSCDMSCLMHIAGDLGRRGSGIEVRHLAQVLDRVAGPPGVK